MDEVEEIKNKIDVVDFIGQYLPLKKAGRNYKGVCPFHSEKTPSFIVSPDKQIWHCFGCGAGGDIFGFLMQKEGLDFSEALAQLAERAGVELRNKPRNWGIKNKLFTINELGAKFFEKALVESQAGRQALNYLVDRGINRSTIKDFRLGYAPSGWEYLTKFLKRKEYSYEDVEKAGLIVNRKGKHFDKFRHRLMFPITNTNNKVVGFTGRVLDVKDQPKYLNSPETPIFNKGGILYGLSITKECIQKENVAILVEGQMDILASYQAGIKNVVASSGTALTMDQLHLIRRYAETLILALDTDSAGSTATKRIIELASTEDLDIKIALLGEFKDPDDCIKASVEKWKEIVSQAVPVVDFYITTALDKFGKDSITAKKKVAAEVLPIINMLDSPVEKDQYLKKLADILGVNSASMYEAIGKLKEKKAKFRSITKQEDVPKKIEKDWLEKRVLGTILYKPIYFEGFQNQLDKLKWSNAFLEQVYEQFKVCYTGKDFSLDNLVAKLKYQDKTELLELIVIIEENYKEMSDGDIGREINFYINLLERRNTKIAMAKLSREIAETEKAGDYEKLQELLKQFKNF